MMSIACEICGGKPIISLHMFFCLQAERTATSKVPLVTWCRELSFLVLRTSVEYKRTVRIGVRVAHLE